jgi:hypothetical protein
MSHVELSSNVYFHKFSVQLCTAQRVVLIMSYILKFNLFNAGLGGLKRVKFFNKIMNIK